MKEEVKLLTSISLFYNVGAGFLSPVYAIFVGNIGGTIVDAGISWAIYSIFLGILTIGIGRMEDHKLDKRKMVFFGYVFVAFCTLGYIIIQSPWQLFLLQFLIGTGVAILTPAWYALFGIFEDDGLEASEWSFWSGGRNIAIGLAALFGGILVNSFGWTFLFIVMFIFQITAAFLALELFKEGNID